MCCFAKPVCLTFIEVKFMGKKKAFFFFRTTPGFFLVGFAGSFSGAGSSQTGKVVTPSAFSGGFNTNSALSLSLHEARTVSRQSSSHHCKYLTEILSI